MCFSTHFRRQSTESVLGNLGIIELRLHLTPDVGICHLIFADVWVKLELTTRKEKAIPLSACMASSSVTSSPA